jgi:hypothetical protein
MKWGIFMVIWKGFGLCVLLALVPAAFAVSHVNNFFITPINSNALLFWLASPLCILINLAIQKYRRATCDEAVIENSKTGKQKFVLVKGHTNKKTGEYFETIVEDSFFFIPVKYWFLACIIIGALYYFLQG